MVEEQQYTGEIYRDKLDFQTYITRQLDRIGNLSSRIFETSRANVWQKNALNYYSAVISFLSVISPYLDDGVSDKVKNIKNEAKMKYQKRQDDKKKSKLTRKGKFSDVQSTIDVSNQILEIIMENLKAKGLLLQEETSLTQY